MPSIHPAIDNGIKKGDPNFSGGKLYCHCPTKKVEVSIGCNVAHNHACGCSKCWKPKGALVSVVGVVPKEAVRVTANEDKLHIIDSFNPQAIAEWHQPICRIEHHLLRPFPAHCALLDLNPGDGAAGCIAVECGR